MWNQRISENRKMERISKLQRDKNGRGNRDFNWHKHKNIGQEHEKGKDKTKSSQTPEMPQVQSIHI
jgi:hypothetical protein